MASHSPASVLEPVRAEVCCSLELGMREICAYSAEHLRCLKQRRGFLETLKRKSLTFERENLLSPELQPSPISAEGEGRGWNQNLP